MPNQPTDPLITVYVMDDDPLARRLMVDEIGRDPHITVVGDAPASVRIHDCPAVADAHVVVLGVQRDDADRLTARIADLIARLRARIIVFAASATVGSGAAAVAAGAFGLIDKDAGTRQLRCAVGAVANGNVVLSQSAAAQFATLVPAEGGRPPAGRLAALTTSESEVLRLLSLGLSTEQTAVRLGISGGTVKSHVSHILAKLGVASRTQAVAMAHRSGLFAPRTLAPFEAAPAGPAPRRLPTASSPNA